MAKTDRNERLAQQLRANLKKRKQQARARKEADGENSGEICKTPKTRGKTPASGGQNPSDN